ncbi:MAG: hypothetical protein PVJ05_07095 [Candidatus Thorarchaeota archaeon]|jgi:hypothetical protein
MQIWSSRHITAFLAIWTLTTPLKVMLSLPRLEHSFIYAGLWSYLPGNPFSDSPLIVSAFYSAFMLPFYAPGLAVSWFVWRSSKDENLTRTRYFEINLMLVLIQTLLTLVIPCPMDYFLCIPTPTTGIMALFFVSRIVKEREMPWIDDEDDGRNRLD